MRKPFLFIITVILFQSCGLLDKEQLVTVGDRYSLSVPAFLKEVNTLNEDASLQYQHALLEFYVIVIDEPKEEFITAIVENEHTELYECNFAGYSELMLDYFLGNITNPGLSSLKDTTVNGMPAKITSLIGSFEGIDVYYKLGLYEGKDNYYQVLAWTLKSRQDKFKSQMNKILYSLKEF